MTSSGIKRGVAATAISALAVAGLPFLAGSASATPLADQVTGLTWLSQYPAYNYTASFNQDGQNETVSLVVAAETTTLQVLFQYSTDDGATWIDIGGPVARTADGVFTTEWAKPATLADGTEVELRAVDEDGNEAENSNVTVIDEDHAIELSTEGTLGVYRNVHTGNDNIAVSGTTGYRDAGDPTAGRQDQAGVSATLNDGAMNTGGLPITWAAGTANTGTFQGVLEYAPGAYPYSLGVETNQISLTGFIDDTEDTEASTLYFQTAAGFTVTATPADNTLTDGQSTDVTVTVTDSTGAPVGGVTVGYLFEDEGENPAPPNPDTPVDNIDEGETDGNGQFVFPIMDPVGPGTADGTYTVYADTSAPLGYNAADIEAAPFAINGFDQALTTVDIVNERSRSNFDTDELSDGDDFTIETQDQEGDPFDETVTPEYRWVIDPTDPNVATITTAWTAAGGTAEDGVYSVEGPSDADAANEGSWTLEARRPNFNGTGLMNATPETMTVSESEITFDEGQSANAQVEGEFTATGTLANDAGGLGGREVTVNYTPAGDSRVAPQNEQPAGVTVVGNSATVITDANGDFAVKLEDPAGPVVVPDVEEEGSNLNALGTAEAANDTDPVDLQDNYGLNDSTFGPDPDNAEADLTVNFVTPTDAAEVDIDVDELLGNFGPGRPANVDVTVFGDEDGDGTVEPGEELSDYPVEISVDKGFLTPYAENGDVDNLDLAVGHDEEGDLWGFFENLGTDEETSTGDFGDEADIAAAIERDTDFDDDGLTEMTITVTAGDVTETETITADSRMPINVASSDLPREEGEETGDVEVGDELDLNYEVTDQFGNLAGDVVANVTDDSTVADFETEDDGDDVRSDYTTSGPSITATSTGATVQTLMATATVNEYLVEDVEDLDTGNRTDVADSDPIVWVEGGKTAITAKLKGKDNGGKDDKLKVVAPAKAAGATVKLFKVKKNGTKVLLKTSTLNAEGDKKFTVADKNGKKVTKYVAKVKATADTKADTTNKKKVK